MSGTGAASNGGKRTLLEWLDVAAKLVGAFAVLAVAVFANSLQSRLSGISIQSQREQAESQLRASMFNSLISPIVGSQKDGKPVPASREVLLAELLALNFHENFELKPLMEDAAARLVAESRESRPPQAGTPDVREPLWSIARRTAERQRASIAREWDALGAGGGERTSKRGFLTDLFRNRARPDRGGCETYTLIVDPKTERHNQRVLPDLDCHIVAAFRDAVDLTSPDGSYILRIWPREADWENQTVILTVWPFRAEQGSPRKTDTSYRFTLTWFDLPFTDNTLLPDGNRFALYLRVHDSDPDTQKVTIMVMWFPVGYFTPRERPLNYREVQDLLGLKAP